MKKNKQLVVNLDAVNLTKKNLAGLHETIHNALAEMVKKPKVNSGNVTMANLPAADNAVPGKTASLEVEFHNVDAGLSDFTATYKGVDKTLDQSGTVSFKNVMVNDIIIIKGSSAGSKVVTISGVNAVPVQMNFAAGQHMNGIFLVIQ